MNLQEILKKYQDRMVEEWIHRLHTEVSDRYRTRPLDELSQTVSMANEANFAVLIHNDFKKSISIFSSSPT